MTPAATAYDVEAVLVLSAVDPAFNGTADPNDFNMHAYRATYWLINGKAYPDTNPIAATAGQRVLLRYLNAGFDNTTMQLLGMHQHVVARDARLLNNPFDANAETIPAGATEDTIATVPSGGAPSTNGFPLYNRQLHLTNGAQTGPTPAPSVRGRHADLHPAVTEGVRMSDPVPRGPAPAAPPASATPPAQWRLGARRVRVLGASTGALRGAGGRGPRPVAAESLQRRHDGRGRQHRLGAARRRRGRPRRAQRGQAHPGGGDRRPVA